jgi:hypothetical protein
VSRSLSFFLAVVLSIAGLAAGCLFPSFEDLDNGSDDGGKGSESGSTSSSSGTSGTTSGSSSGTSGSSSGIVEGGTSSSSGNDSGAGLTFCNGDLCVNGTSFCCVHLAGTTSCVNETNKGSCEGITDTNFRCDDKNDCPAGQVCCQDGFAEDTACASSCDSDDFLLCRTTEGCPTGKTCTLQRDHGYLACTK